MSTQWQTALLIVVLLISLGFTRIAVGPVFSEGNGVMQVPGGAGKTVASPQNNLLFQNKSASLINAESVAPSGPMRKWDVLDPRITAESAMLVTVPDNISLFNKSVTLEWPLASLTKLVTSLVVLDTIGENKKIPISETAVATEGEAGDLRSGEVYTARDLLKIMLLVSSNDAAAAFEEYGGGKEKFAALLMDKLHELGMSETTVYDASGLSDDNKGTAADLLRLANYILANHPEIFGWTRTDSLLVQPINDTRSFTLRNIDGLVTNANFLGGKTGTSPAAQENLLAIFSWRTYRIAMIILGSTDRMADASALLQWLDKAYSG